MVSLGPRHKPRVPLGHRPISKQTTNFVHPFLMYGKRIHLIKGW